MLFVKTFLGLLQLLELFVEVLNSLDGSTEFIIRLKDLTLEVGDVCLLLAELLALFVDSLLEILDLLAQILLLALGGGDVSFKLLVVLVGLHLLALDIAKLVRLSLDRVFNVFLLRLLLHHLLSLSADLSIQSVLLLLLFLDLSFESLFLLLNFGDLLLQLLNGFLALVDAVVDFAGLFLSLHVHLTELVLLFTQSLTVLDLVFQLGLKGDVFLHSLVNLNISLGQPLLLVNNVLLHIFDQRQEHLTLLILLLVELSLQLDFLSVKSTDFLMELLVDVVNFLKLLLDKVEFFVESIKSVPVLILLRLGFLKLQVLALKGFFERVTTLEERLLVGVVLL